MYSILLVLIYIAFISLGLPDSLLGSAWPVIRTQLGVPISYMGFVSMIISGGTILSSLLSDRLTHKLGTAFVTCGSVLLTACALFGFSISSEFWMLCLWAVPYGLGAGAIDAALNNYVALHYSSRHMSWLHCFWGVGTIVSPYIMSFALVSPYSWNGGYRAVSILQFIITAILFATLPLWKKVPDYRENFPQDTKLLKLTHVLKIPGVPLILIGFLSYCAIESTFILWTSSYLVQSRNMRSEKAAAFASLFFIGITAGRFLAGFVSEKLGDKLLIRIGSAIILVGILLILLPFSTDYICLSGFIICGFGCAPIYPSIIHSTPHHFGAENSQAIIGIQMASGYVGSTFMPPVFGWIANNISIRLLPVFTAFFALLMVFMLERLNRLMEQQ